MMACVTVLNVMDRQLLAVLIEPIKEELGASDAAMGLLTGTSFALLHVFASVPVAIWADRGVRRSIIALGLALWSALTCLTGFARSYTEIFLIRVGVGIGEASGGGPAQSLLSDSFPVEQRSTALSIFVMGGPLGSMLAFAAGGWLGETLGWRTAFVIFGAPGLLLALMIRTLVREPERGAFDAERREGEEGQGPSAQLFPAIPVGRATRWIVTTPSMRNFVLASGLNTVGIYTILIWASCSSSPATPGRGATMGALAEDAHPKRSALPPGSPRDVRSPGLGRSFSAPLPPGGEGRSNP